MLFRSDDTNLIGHLRDLSGTAVTHQGDTRSVRRNHRFSAGEGNRVSADHHGEGAVARPIDTSRHRSIEKVDAERAGFGMNDARHLGRRGGVIDPQCPARERRQDHTRHGAQFAIGRKRRDDECATFDRTGRVILAYANATTAELQAYLQGTDLKLKELEAELAATRARGYSTSHSELISGAVAVAVPVFDQTEIGRAHV
mgnify:CR=1 FL=1